MKHFIEFNSLKLFAFIYVIPVLLILILHYFGLFFPETFGVSHILYYSYPLTFFSHVGITLFWFHILNACFSQGKCAISCRIIKGVLCFSFLAIFIVLCSLTFTIYEYRFTLGAGFKNLFYLYLNSMPNWHVEYLAITLIVLAIINFFAIILQSRNITLAKHKRFKTPYFLSMVISFFLLPLGIWYIQSEVRKFINESR